MNVAAILKQKGREVFTTTPDTTLLDITKLLGLHGIGCVVITGIEGKVVGIVSERDVVREIARAGSKVLKEPVETCMTKTVVTCREADTIDRIMAEMTAHRFRHMPVVERGRLSGIVSIGDVVRMRIAEAEMEAAAMREYIATHDLVRKVATFRDHALGGQHPERVLDLLDLPFGGLGSLRDRFAPTVEVEQPDVSKPWADGDVWRIAGEA
jgi:CBS domain-containing protein